MTLISGTWTLGSTADNGDYGDLTVNSGTIIQVVAFCDIYVDSFVLDGTWIRVSPYTGHIHVGSLPWMNSQTLDVNIRLDNYLDSLHFLAR